VLAQRLVRRVCRRCGRPQAPDPAELEALRYEPSDDERARFRRGEGCEACRGTGYHGRVGCFELLVADDEVRQLIHTRSTASAINEAARHAGMHSLREDGVMKVTAGRTTFEEVIRVAIRATF
jgi:type II secretory ATPase GspE/PulE/Tfp pilus assembly ATPase PilB-like protein